MKKLAIGLAALVALVIVVLVAAPFFIPVETYKAQIADAASDATGRELKIDGDFKLSLLPSLELEANKVSFANAPGAKEANMASLEKLVLKLQVWPILSGQIKIDSFVMVEPVIHLEVDENGRANWDFAAKPAKAEDKGDDAAGGGAGLDELSLGDVRLERGRVTYNDAKTGQSLEISDINMTVSLPDLDSPFAADGSLVWNGKKIDLKVESDKLRRLMAGETTPVTLSVESEPINLGYQGKVTTAKVLRVDGKLDLDVPSIRELAAWTGNPIDAPGNGLGPLKIKGNVSVKGKIYAFTDAKISLDEMTATGALTADTSGKRPSLQGTLEIDKVNLNNHLPPPAEGEAQPASAEGGPPPDWSDEPIDLAALEAVNADFKLTVGELLARNLKLGRSTLSLSLKDGLLVVDLVELSLYGGSGQGKITVDGRGKVPSVQKSFALRGVQAEPLPRDATGNDRLEGTGEIEFALTAKGKSQRAMVQALNGKGAVKFTDGAIKGINLAAMVRNVSSAFLESGAAEAQKTDFAELSGTFRIKNGILSNSDLKLLNPLLRLNGAGTSDLPKRMVNYRVEPKVVGTTEGQGGAADVAGVTVPVIVEGPWHDLSYKPDLAAMIGDIAKDPTKALEGAKETVEQLKSGGGDAVGNLIKGLTGGGATDSTTDGGTESGGGILPDAGSTIKKLFGN